MGITRHRATRMIGSVLVVIVVLFSRVAPASASANISVDPTTASPGDTITISGNVPTDGCPSDDAAQLTSTADLFPPDGFGPPAARTPTGDFSTQYSINASTPPGTYSIGVRCGGGNVGISAQLEVVAAPAATTSTTTTTAPKATTTASTTSTTTTTTLPSTLSSSSASSSSSDNSPLPWILLVIAAIVAAGTITYYVRSRRQTP